MQLFLCLFLVLPAMALARPYSVKVFTEPGAEARAQEYIDQMKRLEPFGQLITQGAFVISDAPSIVTSTRCRGGNMGIERLAKCETREVKRLCGKANLCPIFTSFPNIGAGGAPFPISSSSFPWTTMLHEVIHTFGFSDEYAYSQSETNIYCGENKREPNEHQLRLVHTYASEELATNDCRQLIPWCDEAVRSGARVATMNEKGTWVIGSPLPESCPNNQLGVYPGGGCMKKKNVSTFRPYFCPTIMGYPTIGQDHCEVGERHGILVRVPNLLPPYYQGVLFREIVRVSGRRELVFSPRLENYPGGFSYGIPEVDQLPGGNVSEGNRCSKQPEI